MIGSIALLVTLKKAKPKSQSLSRSHIRDLGLIKMKNLITIILTIFMFMGVNAQNKSEQKERTKNEKAYKKRQLYKARQIFSRAEELFPIEAKEIVHDSSEVYFKTDVVLTRCSTHWLCNSLFAKGMLTGEMFYKEANLDPNWFNKDVWTTEEGDTIKNHLWNDGKGSLTILNFEHLSQLDKKDRRYFCIWTTMQTHLTGGHNVYYLVLGNRNANKQTELKEFIINSTSYKLYYSHGEI